MDYQILECGGQLPSSIISSREDVAADSEPQGRFGAVCSKRQGEDAVLTVATEVAAVSSHGQSYDTSPLTGEMPAVLQVVVTGGELDIRSPSSGVPSISSVHKCIVDWLECAYTGQNTSRVLGEERTESSCIGDGLWPSSLQSVCYGSKHKASIVCVSNSRYHNLEAGCFWASVGQSQGVPAFGH